MGDVDQVEGVEVSDESQDRDDPDGGQYQWQLDLQELRPAGYAVHLCGLDHFVGDAQKGGIDQHHRDSDELPDRDQGKCGEGVFFLAQPRGEEELQADRVQHAGGDAPDWREDQLPDEADDHETEDRGDEYRGPVEGGHSQAGGGKDRGEGDADGVLDQHVDHEEPGVVPQGVPESVRPEGVAEEGREVLEADKDALTCLVLVHRGLGERPE